MFRKLNDVHVESHRDNFRRHPTVYMFTILALVVVLLVIAVTLHILPISTC